ncbi:expressed unknown protein [Seminavis robusta]|uniref:Sulfotransferase domain-containing protein n=1 Tax=Seminavis robusta TaxID=568900 RepID=A0A9N8H1L4_9STRA|nr:expressed unknown protein [Seminavis robusta]|eukprot:Sro19_g013470.1 n/a (513) ;mRNA; f:88159-89697
MVRKLNLKKHSSAPASASSSSGSRGFPCPCSSNSGSSTISSGHGKRSRLSQVSQPLNTTLAVPAWKLATIIALTLCLGMSLRELLPVVMSQDQLTIFLNDLTTSTTTDGTGYHHVNQPQPIIHAEGTNRSILLIHVGKAAGSTLRRATKVLCKSFKDPRNPQKVLHRSCCGKNTLDQRTVPLTGKLIQDVYHMWAYNDTIFPRVTTYLITVRNPIDRIISTYRYSHPDNCPTHLLQEKVLLPWACQLHKNGKLTKPHTPTYQLFRTCFPSAAMEDFAQSVASPWVNGSYFAANLTVAQQWKCRKIARSVVTGNGPANSGSAPHMEFNYHYYAKETMLRYPDKEIMAIRTEQEWEDLLHLDKFLGGAGIIKDVQREITHGSADFAPSPLSIPAIQKLCCVLVQEIELYATILHRALNLSPQAKQESLHDVYQTCNISTTTTTGTLPSWDDWKSACQKRLADDATWIGQQKLATSREMMTNKWGQGLKDDNVHVDWQARVQVPRPQVLDVPGDV